MFTELNQITGFFSNICVIAIAVWMVVKYYRLKKYLNKIYMNMDELIDQIYSEADQSIPCSTTEDNKVKERLIHVVASGKSKQYLGRLYSTDEIEKLDDKELSKLYARYEAVLGGQITQTLKQHMIYAYTRAFEFLCPTVSQGRLAVYDTDEMCKHLNDGPFIDLALTSLTCKMYHEYGHFLAPIEAILLSSNFVRPVEQQTLKENQLVNHLANQQNLSS